MAGILGFPTSIKSWDPTSPWWRPRSKAKAVAEEAEKGAKKYYSGQAEKLQAKDVQGYLTPEARKRYKKSMSDIFAEQATQASEKLGELFASTGRYSSGVSQRAVADIYAENAKLMQQAMAEQDINNLKYIAEQKTRNEALALYYEDKAQGVDEATANRKYEQYMQSAEAFREGVIAFADLGATALGAPPGTIKTIDKISKTTTYPSETTQYLQGRR